jgi:uncharacterized membrane protein
MANERRQRTLYLLALAVVLLLAAFLRFYRLDASSLWSDEGNTWAMLSRSYGEIAQAAASDIHPPGYYWLLKAWSSVMGTSAWAMRSFSAVMGILLVLVVAGIGRVMAPKGTGRDWLPLLAALLVAVNPLLIYYSQEARMYMLLALAGSGVFWAMLAGPLWSTSNPFAAEQSSLPLKLAALYVLFAAMGLWTHYSFVIVLAAANVAFLARWLYLHFRAQSSSGPASLQSLAVWSGLTALALLAFLPWLPTAVDSVLHWPKGGVAVSWAAGMQDTLRTFVFGPLHATPEPLWLFLAAGALLPVLGFFALLLGCDPGAPLRRYALPLLLWLGLPVGLMAGLGLFTDAFLKFLITAAPAWCLLAACVPLLARDGVLRRAMAAGMALAAVGMAGFVLPAYYTDVQARDNYQGIASYIRSASDPQRDLVILNAPGQQEVWRYYDPGLPVLALPTTRPPAEAEVAATLAQAAEGRRNVYALFWATDEADPQRLVETWLDHNAFKALDTWQGNVRLATYRMAPELVPVPMDPILLAGAIVLYAQAQPQSPQQVTAGDVALVQLQWNVQEDVDRRFKVSVQLLNAANQVMAQRDGEPAGGSQSTDTWRAGDVILDNYALPVPLGTPPGEYRLVATMYDAATGQRLAHADGDSIALGAVQVNRPSAAAPAGIIPMAHRLDLPVGPVFLRGYDAYRKDFAHAPETPLRPGDAVRVVLYWQAPSPLPPDWPADLAVTLRLGDQITTGPLAAVDYPTGVWQPGELVRGQFDVLYSGKSAQLQAEVGGEAVILGSLPVE